MDKIELKDVALTCLNCKAIFKLDIIERGTQNKRFCALCGHNITNIITVSTNDVVI